MNIRDFVHLYFVPAVLSCVVPSSDDVVGDIGLWIVARYPKEPIYETNGVEISRIMTETFDGARAAKVLSDSDLDPDDVYEIMRIALRK